MSDNPNVVVTITIYPFDKGKRKVLVSGAPEGEMPVVHTGQFAELHALIDRTWIELSTRKPQVVTRRAGEKAKPDKTKEGGEDGSEENVAAELSGQPSADTPTSDPNQTQAETVRAEPEDTGDLPVIQNEQEMNA